MMTFDFTVQLAVIFWGMLAVLMASAAALIVQGVSAAFAARTDGHTINVIPLAGRTRIENSSLRSAA